MLVLLSAEGQPKQCESPYLFAIRCLAFFPLARSRREEFAPFQTAEAIDVRRKSDAFGEKLDAYRSFFLQRAPFAVASGELGLEHVSARRWRTLLLPGWTTLQSCPLHQPMCLLV